MGKIIFIEPDKCTGCRICEMICSFKNCDAFHPGQSRIKIIKEEELGIDLPVLCLHCQEPVCVDVCPIGAMEKRKDGLVTLDPDMCRGCRACMMVCPYGAVRENSEKMIKCDLCDGDPLCVQWCPTHAIRWIPAGSSEIPRDKKMIQMIMKNLREDR